MKRLLNWIKKYPLFLLAIICLLIGVWIIKSVLLQGRIIAIDTYFLQFLFSVRNSFIVQFFSILTFFGSVTAGLTIILLTTILFVWRKQHKTGLLFLFGFLCADGTAYLLKYFFQRARPDLIYRAVTETSFALPSGHATTSAFIFGLLGFLALLRFKTKRIHIIIIAMVLICILLIDFSRLYLGVHFFSDVLLGNTIGFFFLFVTISVYKWLLNEHRLKK